MRPRSASPIASCFVGLVMLALAESSAAAAACPNILLVLDQSGSMADDVNGHHPDGTDFVPPSKFDLMVSVIDKLVAPYANQVPFGLELFTGPAAPRDVMPQAADNNVCFANQTVQVPVSLASAPAITSALHAAHPDAETNTNGAIRRARMEPSLLMPGGQKIIILVTDGDPNCGVDGAYTNLGEPLGTPDGMPGGTLSELDLACKAGIRTYVVGFSGEGVNTTNLNLMAYYGRCGKDDEGKPLVCNDTTPCYYKAGLTTKDLEATLSSIITPYVNEVGEMCDSSCRAVGCPSGQTCATDEQNTMPHCVPTSEVHCDDAGNCHDGPGAGCSCRIGGGDHGNAGSDRAGWCDGSWVIIAAIGLARFRSRSRRRR